MAIRNDILQEVQRAKYYTVIADKVTDVSNKEQLSLSICYVSSSTVKETFLDFVEVQRITGKCWVRLFCIGSKLMGYQQ